MESKKVSMIVLYVHEFQDLLAQHSSLNSETLTLDCSKSSCDTSQGLAYEGLS